MDLVDDLSVETSCSFSSSSRNYHPPPKGEDTNADRRLIVSLLHPNYGATRSPTCGRTRDGALKAPSIRKFCRTPDQNCSAQTWICSHVQNWTSPPAGGSRWLLFAPPPPSHVALPRRAEYCRTSPRTPPHPEHSALHLKWLSATAAPSLHNQLLLGKSLATSTVPDSCVLSSTVAFDVIYCMFPQTGRYNEIYLESV